MFPSGESRYMAVAAAVLTYYCMSWYGDMANEVIPGKLWVGNIAAAWAPGTMDQVEITHIVCVTQFGAAAAFYPDRYEYHVIAVQDTPDQQLLPNLTAAADYIKRAIDNGGTVLVHCNQGRSRSVTVTVAFLMRHCDMSLLDAMQLVRDKRPVACPNPGFFEQLKQYAEQCRASHKAFN